MGPVRNGTSKMRLGAASVVVDVSDPARAIQVYAGCCWACGCPPHRNPTVCVLSGHLRLILHRDKLPARAGGQGALEFDLSVPDLGAFHAAPSRRGITAPPPKRLPWGWLGTTVRDPDGNVVAFCDEPDGDPISGLGRLSFRDPSAQRPNTGRDAGPCERSRWGPPGRMPSKAEPLPASSGRGSTQRIGGRGGQI